MKSGKSISKRNKKAVNDANGTAQTLDRASAATVDEGATAAGAGEPAQAQNRQFLAAFQRVAGEISSVPHDELATINVDVSTVVTTIVGAYPEIAALREPILKLGGFDVALLDKLRDYACALGHAQTLFTMSDEKSSDLAELASEGLAIRDQLRADATALAKRGLVSENFVSKLENGISYRSIAFDLVAISEALIAAWVTLEGRVAFTHSELVAASSLGNRMVELVGEREQAPATKDKAVVLRQQAFTLCMAAYEEVREAVAFVRRKEQDGETIAPSVFSNRNRRRGSSGDEAVLPTAPTQSLPNAAAQGASGTSTDGGAASTALSRNSVNTPLGGQLGSSPFTQS